MSSEARPGRARGARRHDASADGRGRARTDTRDEPRTRRGVAGGRRRETRGEWGPRAPRRHPEAARSHPARGGRFSRRASDNAAARNPLALSRGGGHVAGPAAPRWRRRRRRQGSRGSRGATERPARPPRHATRHGSAASPQGARTAPSNERSTPGGAAGGGHARGEERGPPLPSPSQTPARRAGTGPGPDREWTGKEGETDAGFQARARAAHPRAPGRGTRGDRGGGRPVRGQRLPRRARARRASPAGLGPPRPTERRRRTARNRNGPDRTGRRRPRDRPADGGSVCGERRAAAAGPGRGDGNDRRGSRGGGAPGAAAAGPAGRERETRSGENGQTDGTEEESRAGGREERARGGPGPRPPRAAERGRRGREADHKEAAVRARRRSRARAGGSVPAPETRGGVAPGSQGTQEAPREKPREADPAQRNPPGRARLRRQRHPPPARTCQPPEDRAEGGRLAGSKHGRARHPPERRGHPAAFLLPLQRKGTATAADAMCAGRGRVTTRAPEARGPRTRPGHRENTRGNPTAQPQGRSRKPRPGRRPARQPGTSPSTTSGEARTRPRRPHAQREPDDRRGNPGRASRQTPPPRPARPRPKAGRGTRGRPGHALSSLKSRLSLRSQTFSEPGPSAGNPLPGPHGPARQSPSRRLRGRPPDRATPGAAPRLNPGRRTETEPPSPTHTTSPRGGPQHPRRLRRLAPGTRTGTGDRRRPSPGKAHAPRGAESGTAPPAPRASARANPLPRRRPRPRQARVPRKPGGKPPPPRPTDRAVPGARRLSGTPARPGGTLPRLGGGRRGPR